MAIDPSIALQAKAPQGPNMQDMMGMAQTGQNIQNAQQQNQLLQAQTANAQAQNPGIQAQSQTAQQTAVNSQRENQAQQITQQIMQQNMRTNPDGTQTLDVVGASNDFAKAGLPDQSSKMLKPYLDNLASNTDIVTKLQSNNADLQKFQMSVIGPMLNTAAKIQDPTQRSAYLDKAYAGAEAQYPQLFPKGNTAYADALVSRAHVDANGAANFAQTPAEAKKLSIDQLNAESSRIGALAAATNAQTGVINQTQGTVAAVNDATTKASNYGQGAAAVDAMRDPKTGQLPAGIAGMKGAELKAAIDTDPNFAAVKTAIAQATANGYPIDLSGGVIGVQNGLKLAQQHASDAAQRVTQTQAAAGRPVSGPTTPTGAPPTVGPQAKTPQAAAAEKSAADAAFLKHSDPGARARIAAAYQKATGQPYTPPASGLAPGGGAQGSW